MNSGSLFEKIIHGDRQSLAKAITLVESTLDEHRIEAEQLIKSIVQHPTKSIRVAVSGIPGVGKSSFIEALGLYLIEKFQKKVAVLAIDPSSPIGGGSLLGDKTRMQELSKQENAFIRPSPNSQTLGGVHLNTRESILLCEAAGFDVILVETVGVGQSEMYARYMVDFFATFLLPKTGDQLQGLKKGIVEVSDLICIHKSDGDNEPQAKQTAFEYKTALSIFNPQKKDPISILETSIYKPKSIAQFWEVFQKMESKLSESGRWEEKRRQQKNHWLKESILFNLHRRMEDLWAANQKEQFDTPYEIARNITTSKVHPTD
ncbi:MAG: methylmalonyl Co-A mutase-associated GTPase MeaB [Bacteroidota bacterium]|nr:methylmalonyl Co-A mutase-associated GTPase MeaB [Bacteroidota bacterium]